MIVSAIVAAANNRVIGRDNQIPWYLSSDLKYFKKKTLGHYVIMGRKSYDSIGRPLPKRTNVIVTRNLFYTAENCLVTHSVEEALELALDNGETEVFIIGGAEIYKLSLPYLDKLYLTKVDAEIEGHVYFPELDWNEWTEISTEAHQADEKNDHDYTFCIYERKQTEK